MDKSQKKILAKEIIVNFKIFLLAILCTAIAIPLISKKEIEGYLLKKDYENAKKLNENLVPIENKIYELYHPLFLDQEGFVTTPDGETLRWQNSRSSDGCVYLKMVSESSAEEVIDYYCLVSNAGDIFSKEKNKTYLKILFGTFLLITITRYLTRGVKWVIKNSKE